MFYHYNNIANEERPVLGESLKGDNENQSFHHTLTQSNKSMFGKMFSEKFQWIKNADKTVSDVVFPKKSTIRLLILIILFIGFLYFGAWCFQMLEHDNEMAQRDQFKKFRKMFMDENRCVSDKSLENFIIKVEKLKDMGFSAQLNESEMNWDIPTGVFFVTTLVTTIGYGNVKPMTIWGKVFCITFVAIGLPTMMILATAIIERMCVFTDLTFSYFCYRNNWKTTENKFREIQIIVCLFILMIGFIFIPAAAFFAMEEGRWGYLDSIYYCVISLTTIGLGDFVPGGNSDKTIRDLTKILTTAYLFIGLLWASFCIQIFHQYHRWNVGSKFFYLRSEYTNFEYDILVNSNSIVSMQESPGDNDGIFYTEIEPLNQPNEQKGKRSRFKSYS